MQPGGCMPDCKPSIRQAMKWRQDCGVENCNCVPGNCGAMGWAQVGQLSVDLHQRLDCGKCGDSWIPRFPANGSLQATTGVLGEGERRNERTWKRKKRISETKSDFYVHCILWTRSLNLHTASHLFNLRLLPNFTSPISSPPSQLHLLIFTSLSSPPYLLHLISGLSRKPGACPGWVIGVSRVVHRLTCAPLIFGGDIHNRTDVLTTSNPRLVV